MAFSQWTRSPLQWQPETVKQWPRAAFRALPGASRSEVSRLVCLESERHASRQQTLYPWCQWELMDAEDWNEWPKANTAQ